MRPLTEWSDAEIERMVVFVDDLKESAKAIAEVRKWSDEQLYSFYVIHMASEWKISDFGTAVLDEAFRRLGVEESPAMREEAKG